MYMLTVTFLRNMCKAMKAVKQAGISATLANAKSEYGLSDIAADFTVNPKNRRTLVIHNTEHTIKFSIIIGDAITRLMEIVRLFSVLRSLAKSSSETVAPFTYAIFLIMVLALAYFCLVSNHLIDSGDTQ